MWSAERHKQKTQERDSSVLFLPSSFPTSWQSQQLPDPKAESSEMKVEAFQCLDAGVSS